MATPLLVTCMPEPSYEDISSHILVLLSGADDHRLQQIKFAMADCVSSGLTFMLFDAHTLELLGAVLPAQLGDVVQVCWWRASLQSCYGLRVGESDRV